MKNGLVASPFCLPSSSASAALIGILAHTGELAVGLGHEGLQLLFKQLVCSFGSSRLYRSTLGTVIPVFPVLIAVFPGLEIAAFPVLIAAFSALEVSAFPTLESALPALEIAALSLRLGLQALDGQVDFSVVGADDHDLHILTLGQMLADVTDICVGHLGNMYHAGLVFRQGDECAEVGDGFDFAL